MPALVMLIQSELQSRGWSLRTLAERSDVSHAALSKIINNPGRIPELGTLEGLARGLEMPLSRLVEACGFTVDKVPTREWEQRAQTIIAAVPELRDLLDPLAKLPPDDRDAVLAYIDNLRQRRERRKD